MQTKIIILSPIPISSKLITDFYINELMADNVMVEYWDFSSMFFEHNNEQSDKYRDLVIKISTKEKFTEFLNNNNNINVLMITGFTFCYRFLSIYKILNNYSFPLAIFARGALPSFSSTKSKTIQILHKLVKIINPLKWRNIFQGVYALIFKSIGLTKKIDFIFKAGERGLFTIGNGYSLDVKSASKIVDINYFDYDKFLGLKNGNLPKKLHERYIVFLDDYLPHHPDFDLMSMQKIDPFNYYLEINIFFEYIERLTGLKVLIAAHPKAKYDVNPFDNRMIYFGQTLELVLNSDFVLSHASSSLSFAVCCEKGIILMTSNDMKSVNGGYLNQLILGFQGILGAQVIDISSDAFNIEMSEIKVDLDKYSKYKYTYLTNKGSEEKLTLDIFMNFIKTYSAN